MTSILVVPDTQCRPGVPNDHMRWLGRYILDRKPDVVVHLGDNWDLPSLSLYDRGKLQMEGRRYADDVRAGNEGLALLTAPLENSNRSRRNRGTDQYQPRLVLLRGNHEDRIRRAVEENGHLEGTLSFDDLKSPGWEVYPYLEPIEIEGIHFAHFFANPMSGKPYGGQAITRLKTLGHSFVQGHQQVLEFATRFVAGRKQTAIIAGACFTPDHLVLTADLRYVPLGDIGPGDELVSFDETTEQSPRRSRSYKTGTVLATRIRPAEVFGVTLSNGKTFKVTADHRWLVRVGGQTSMKEHGTYQWRATTGLRRGTLVPQPLEVWDTLTSYDAGYLPGMYDGEGCFYTRKTSGGYVGQLSLSQKKGAVLDRTLAVLESICGFEGLSSTNQNGVDSIRIKGGTASIAKVLGQIRPVRLLPKFRPELLGSMTSTVSHKVVEIAPLGIHDIVEIDVDAKTMIVEGTPQHNCYIQDENYKGPQGNHHWRGCLVLHEVDRGSFDMMEVSLDFLCRKYEGMPLNRFLRETYPDQTGTLWR